VHVLGEQAQAKRHIERMLDGSDAAPHRPRAVRFGLDQRVAALNHLARILWLQGFPDRAMRAAQAGVAEARAAGHANSLCLVLADGIAPVAIEMGDLAPAEDLVTLLMTLADRHALSLWHAHGLGLRGLLLTRRGAADAGAVLLQTAVDGLREGVVGVRCTMHLGWLADALAAGGRAGEAVARIDEALRRCRQSEELWCLPELLRLKGELLARSRGEDAAAEDMLLQALDEGRRHGALSWELRAAMSLARLRLARGEGDAGRSLVARVHARFTEGFETADLQAAKTLIAAAA
jgi:hypothetical protein